MEDVTRLVERADVQRRAVDVDDEEPAESLRAEFRGQIHRHFKRPVA